jgi:hypothetical protein
VFRAGVYCGWVGFGYGNLGDLTSYEVCRKRFPAIHWSPIAAFDYTPKPGQFLRRSSRDFRQITRMLSEELSKQRRLRGLIAKATHRVARFSGGEVGICGGETFINRNLASIRSYTGLRKRTGAPVPVLGTGVAEPDFWPAREDGWIDRRKEWVTILEELPTVGVRGPLSKGLLEEAGARNIVISGDPAVSLHKGYIQKQRQTERDGRLRIGINVGPYPRTWGRAEDIQDATVALAQWLHKARHEIELIPIWPRDIEACLEVARRAELPESSISPICFPQEVFLSRVQNLDLMVAMNLHSGILAAVANVPFVSLEYQPKCRDFAATIGWEEFVIRTDELKPQRLIDLVCALIAQLGVKRAELCRSMCDLMNTFENYCCEIEPLLVGSRTSTQ